MKNIVILILMLSGLYLHAHEITGYIKDSNGLPIEGVAVIAGIDRVLDMARTTVNVSGDATVALVVDRMEGHFDEKIYDAEIVE